MYILGISCFYHESAAALLYNGTVVAASAEERFSRKKHDSGFPHLAIAFCLKHAGITTSDIAYIVFYEKPFWKFHRILQSIFTSYPSTSRLFAKAMTTWLIDKLWVRSIIADTLNIDSKKILFVPHHVSHAAASYYPSGFTDAAIMVFDGVGEWATTTFGSARDTAITLDKQITFPHSLGLLYSAFTAFLGFEVNDGEYKVMGMAPYGTPRYVDKVKQLIELFPDGSYRLRMEYFMFHTSVSRSYTDAFVGLFGQPRPRKLHFFTKKSGYPSYFGPKPLNFNQLARQNQEYADIAASIQSVTEEILLLSAKHLHQKTKSENLCFGGGVALNSVANGVLLEKSSFKRIFIQPAAGDDGGALGAALYAYHAILGNKRRNVQTHAYFGIGATDDEIETFLKANAIPYKKYTSEKTLITYLVNQLIANKVIGFFHGRAEWGPRALGARSIIANPMNEQMKDIVNVQIKFREPYRPFAPVTLAEKASDYFDMGNKDHSFLTNYMLAVFPVRASKRTLVPAITHVDGSARPQIISEKQNARYYHLIQEFGNKTGVYVLLNTSFNLKGEPIVNSPAHAFRTFKESGLDILVLEKYVILKKDIE